MFSSNGNGSLIHDCTGKDGNIETEISLDDFPTPQQLWQKYKKYKGIENIEDIQTLTIPTINEFGSVTEIIKAFGNGERSKKPSKN